MGPRFVAAGAEFSAWLTGARWVFVPHAEVGQRLSNYFPQVRFIERRHFDEPVMGRQVAAKPQPGEPLRVAIIGAIGLHKGAEVLQRCAEDCARPPLAIRFQVIGFTDRDPTLAALGNVDITGEYREEDVLDLIESRRCHCAFVSSVWPETYCYTLSIAFLAGLFPVAFDLGSQGARIRESGWGELIPLATPPAKINDRLIALREGILRGSPPSP